MGEKSGQSSPTSDINVSTAEAPSKGGWELLDTDQQQERPDEYQVGGDHYSNMSIGVSEFLVANDIGWLEGNAIKYLCRHSKVEKGKEQDIRKAIHYCELILQWQYEVTDNASNKN